MSVVRVEKQILLGLLEKAISVVPTRGSQVVTNSLSVSVLHDPNELEVTASDGSIWISVSTENFKFDTHFTAVFPAHKFLEIAKEAPEGEIHIHVENGVANIFADRVSWTLTLGINFPSTPFAEAGSQAIPKKEFLDAIGLTKHAAGKDGVRQHCMMLDVRNGRMTATDGAGRLQQVNMAKWPEGLELQIPRSSVDDLVKAVSGEGDLLVCQDDNFLMFQLPSVQFVIRKSVHQFPDVESLTITPALTMVDSAAACDLKALQQAIRRARITAHQETSSVVLEFTEKTLSVQAQDNNGNSAAEVIDCRWKGQEGRKVCVNHRYLTDLLRSLSSSVVIMKLGPDTTKALSPLILQDVESKVLGMAFQMRSY